MCTVVSSATASGLSEGQGERQGQDEGQGHGQGQGQGQSQGQGQAEAEAKVLFYLKKTSILSSDMAVTMSEIAKVKEWKAKRNQLKSIGKIL